MPVDDRARNLIVRQQRGREKLLDVACHCSNVLLRPLLLGRDSVRSARQMSHDCRGVRRAPAGAQPRNGDPAGRYAGQRWAPRSGALIHSHASRAAAAARANGPVTSVTLRGDGGAQRPASTGRIGAQPRQWRRTAACSEGDGSCPRPAVLPAAGCRLLGRRAGELASWRASSCTGAARVCTCTCVCV